MTKYKKAILDIINCSCTHLKAEEVFNLLKKEMPDVVLATVYNNLNSLVKDELIRKITLEDNIDRFDKNTKHDHVICKKCGKIMDINISDLTKSLKSKTNLNIIGYDLKVFYICDECKKGEK